MSIDNCSQMSQKRRFGSPGYSTLLLHSVWTSLFDRCLIKLPTSEYVSPQFGGSWTLESSSLCHHPTVIIALNRTIRDGSSYVSCLTPIPEEWLVEKDWFIVNHWEDQFCRDVYQDLCVHAEFQHLRATALLSPGTTPRVCPVDNLMNTRPSPPLGDQVTLETLDPCAWRYVLTMDDLASYRLKTRSDVVGTWEIASTTYNHFYCQVKVEISAQCFTQPASKSGKSYCGEQSDKAESAQVVHTRIFLLPPEATRLTRSAFAALRKDPTQPTGASKAYHESQSRIYKMEAPMFVGVGEGTDTMDFLADLSALKVISPEEVTRARPVVSDPVPKSESPLLQKLKQGDVPYAYCAWCKEALKTRSMLEEHYYAIHHVVLQPSCCAPPSMFQTIMGKELRWRQENIGSFSTRRIFLRAGLRREDAKDILGATCSVLEDKTKVWHVRMPEFVELGMDQPSLKTPMLYMLEEDESNLNDYLDDPTDPVLCVPEQDHDHYWRLLKSQPESSLGGPGSTMNFWQLSAHSERLTLGVKMHSTAAFLSMNNEDGVVLGGSSGRGFNDNTVRGYPLRLALTTRQVTDVVMFDAEILSVKLCRPGQG